jgi:hypothetical protein
MTSSRTRYLDLQSIPSSQGRRQCVQTDLFAASVRFVICLSYCVVCYGYGRDTGSDTVSFENPLRALDVVVVDDYRSWV